MAIYIYRKEMGSIWLLALLLQLSGATLPQTLRHLSHKAIY